MAFERDKTKTRNNLMKYEFVDFYPYHEGDKVPKNGLGTCHVYMVDQKLDLRGILVKKNKKGFLFLLPHLKQIDPDTGKSATYPVFRFNTQEQHRELIDFLFKECSAAIWEKIKPKKPKYG